MKKPSMKVLAMFLGVVSLTASLGGSSILGAATIPSNEDIDGDGISNVEEIQKYRTNPRVVDTDGDGVSDGVEVEEGTSASNFNDPGHVITPHVPVEAKIGVNDIDGDGLADMDEIGIYLTDPHVADTDNDGFLDAYEIIAIKTNPDKVDSDGDGISDGNEVEITKTDPNKVDTDGDGLNDGGEFLYGYNVKM